MSDRFNILALTVATGALIGTLIYGCPDANAVPLQEDDYGWDCRTMGNHVCGPDSDETGYAPGCYDDRGSLVAEWPCYIVVNPNGTADVFTPDDRSDR